MTDKTALTEEVLGIARSILKDQSIRPETMLVGLDGRCSSVDVLRLIGYLEKRFRVSFDIDDIFMRSLANVEAIAEWIARAEKTTP